LKEGNRVDQLTSEDVKELFGISHIPGAPEEQKILVHWAQMLSEQKGNQYIRKYRKRLYKEWKLMLQLGLSKV
jgi:hypothetical protein